MGEAKRVLHIFAEFNQGGIENMIMNIYRNINRNLIQFDFALTAGKKGVFDDEVLSRGGRIFYFSNPEKKTIVNYTKNLTNIIKNNGPFVAVHSHCYFFSGYILMIAKFCRVRKRIAHAHDVYKGQKLTIKRKYFEKLSQFIINIFATERLGCSNDACIYVFGSNCFSKGNTYVLNNAIDTNRFVFNEDKRQEIRKKFGLSNKFVLCHVGRFVKQKNHNFLLDVFEKVHSYYLQSELLLVGDGPLRVEIFNKIKEMKLDNCVVMLGNRSDIGNILQAVDLFIFPSLYEGLGIPIIEAQASGLHCIISSDLIPKEVYITDLVEGISLGADKSKWVELILKYRNGYIRENRKAEIEAAGFDISCTTKKLTEMYMR